MYLNTCLNYCCYWKIKDALLQLSLIEVLRLQNQQIVGMRNKAGVLSKT